MKVIKKKPTTKKEKFEDLAPKTDPKGGFTGGVFVAAGDVNHAGITDGTSNTILFAEQNLAHNTRTR
jgi:hypothetical protein